MDNTSALSLPVWGAWIETPLTLQHATGNYVAPRVGSVD
jgi:hypothetical protein